MLADMQEEMYIEDECAQILSEIDELKDPKTLEKQLHETLHQNISFSQTKFETIPI